MENLIKVQMNLYDRMSKALHNYKKSPKDRITKQYLETRMEVLDGFWSQINDNHSNIINMSKGLTEPYFNEDIIGNIENLYLEYKTILKLAFSSLQGTSKDNSNVNVPSFNIKLPRIVIPTFSGQYSEWTTFRDLFVSLVHSNSQLDNVQKMHYLKGYLSGEAEQLLRQIPIADSNYERCWSLLNSRYNNKKYLSHFILKRLLSQKNITCESSYGLKNLIDTTNDCLSSLTNLGIDVSTWDIIIIHILTLKLDPESRKQWEFSVTNNNTSDELPTFKQFTEFLTNRYRDLEFLDSKPTPVNRNINVQNNSNNTSKVNTLKTFHASSFKNQCAFCKDNNHSIINCTLFSRETVEARRNFVHNNNLCFNCLGGNHSAKFCRNLKTCRICKRQHHSLLHPSNKGTAETNPVSTKNSNTLPPREVTSSCSEVETPVHVAGNSTPLATLFSTEQARSQVLLATALVKAASKTGEHVIIRALLDQGSQASFVTEATVQYLGLRKIPITEHVSVLGGDNKLSPKTMVLINLKSLVDPSYDINVKAYVLKTITSLLPSRKLDILEWLETLEIELADPNYRTPNKIDILLGAEVYGKVIREGIKRGPQGSPVAQCTSFGWIVSGEIKAADRDIKLNEYKTFHCRTDENDMLKRFWELESDLELTKHQTMSDEELICEKLFNSTTKRNEDEFCNKYEAVMEEYLHHGHMEPVPISEENVSNAVYLPHHAVVRDDKDTTKLRVVFDASAKGKNEVSLNDCLLIGPSLQPDLRHILMRWRIHPICLVADIEKMYRMVNVAREHVDFQRIIWKDNKSGEDRIFRLLTVTFGTASAPYLAIKALQQVAIDEGINYPLAAKVTLNDFYVDDLLSGCESVEQGLKLYNEMNAMLSKGGFKLHKWSSNSNTMLESIKGVNSNEETIEGIHLKLDNVLKILGITWDRSSDSFVYSVNLPEMQQPVTKRKILADVARLYDPLGWIAPTIVLAKAMIQKLWLAGLTWDEIVPTNLMDEWITYRDKLKGLSEFRLPRWLGTTSNNTTVELHGFCDASKMAYAAAIYIRVINPNGFIHSSLIAAKTKVAPVKQVSIPRLELCGAVLLTRLILEVAEVMNIPKANLHAWTDSTIVLAWLNSHPSRWKVFIANRVSEILCSLDSHQWAHVISKQNPADCASRGLQPSELTHNELWLKGPEFLTEGTIQYAKPKDISTDLEAVKTHCAVVNTPFIERFSSLTRLTRVIAYCRRFIAKTKRSKDIETTYLSSEELAAALEVCIRFVQQEYFKEELSAIYQNKTLSKKSKLFSLNPFLDEKQLLRVGGRLEQSNLSRERKHPILLPRTSSLSKLIVENAHKCTLHGGHQLVLNFLQSKYWILGAKQLVKATTRNCITCVKNAAITKNQMMGQLPTARSTPCRPFKRSGVDYAGPIHLRTSKGRGHHSYKGYICLFVCMSTRAIHLEVVSDLTAQAFLQAFKRFVARRGHCQDIWSDNGTSFTGAAAELKKMFASEAAGIFKEVAESLAINGTNWHFIPPHSPNFGGLWEAGVRSVKFHLKRVIGDSTLTFEEMSTVLAQIEACLNSRPLCGVTDDPNVEVLTPAHFLVGESLVTPPDYNYEHDGVASLRRWQYTQRMLQSFWRKWSQEYLTKFLHRYKWATPSSSPAVGDIVVVKEDGLPPCRWLYGRIIDTHPGLDNVVRVVTIKTNKNTVLKRPTSKLCILPIEK
ncbi:uncharacterized protein LOC123668885 [Melitaea cinxia]|uniref:uncharacterized protein LOC123668885 n=1 Tax=Melitaea cinxia TaxID=113334 RepID=UPI001E26F5B2|nr:uncharacterized protein LOC123668885 [Melitaea cinxia]